MKPKVVVIIPVYKEVLNDFEEVSVRQTFKVLSEYPIHFICSTDLNSEYYNRFGDVFSVTRFHLDYFTGVDAYSKLLMSKSFYKKFRAFNFMLICQTDAFCFKNELLHWCEQGYDYIGAPWYYVHNAELINDSCFGIGNGGFSLRKISSHLRVLNTFRYVRSPYKVCRKMWYDTHSFSKTFNSFKEAAFADNNFFYLFPKPKVAEDVFWSDIVPKHFSWFSIPNEKIAGQFSIEHNPLYLIHKNGGKLPFGCHAWWSYNYDIWKPLVENQGYKLP